ncbi:WD and tetratricopeptide repeats protein [Tritrichomonas musculus]|uniref:WD and tetratricopeptide repeats protein n=1 Tax=Tritrichomonas musculus TaxID=1915356 RepID=A0ABR2KZ69_9EUKA
MNLSSLLYQHRRGEEPDCLNCYLNKSIFNPCSMTNAMTLSGHRGCINTCSFNPYGDYELTGCDDGSVWLWDIGNRNLTPKAMLSPHITNVFTTNFLTGNRFISGGNDASVQVIEIAEGRATTTKYDNHHIRKVLCSFVIDENTFATCSHDRTVRLFDIRTQYTNQTIKELPLLTPADFDYDGQEKLILDLERYNIRGQNEGGGLVTKSSVPTDNGSLLLDLRDLPDADFYTMDIHPIDRKRFITSGSDGTVRMFDLRMIKQHKPQNIGFGFNHHYNSRKSVTGAAFDATGDRIAATVIGGNIHVLDTASAVDLSTIPQPRPPRHRGPTIDLRLLINEETHELDFSRLADIIRAQGNAMGEEEEEEEAIEELQETEGSATVTDTVQTVQTSEAVETTETVTVTENPAPANNANRSRANRVRPKVTGEIIELKGGHQSMDTIKAVNWFGDYVVTGSDDGRIYFYDVNNSDVIQILSGHRGNVNVVAVHREKELLSTSGIDDFAILWEPMEIGKFNLQEVREQVQHTREENPPDNGIRGGCSIC